MWPTSKKKQGHYCKVCGEYKANEKFSGKGHAAHICKAYSRLSVTEQAEAMTINRLMNLSMGRLNSSDKEWLENRLHDQRPEVAATAREIYNLHFPFAERNARKKKLIINTLSFELHTAILMSLVTNTQSTNDLRQTASAISSRWSILIRMEQSGPWN